MKFYFFAFLPLLLALIPSTVQESWNDPTSEQFHIQTDEGPERYFRYQTHNGQYRKEKRLQDGTVVGSYGWIDSNGYLRLRDYIADNAGYRILRTKNVYVGRNRPISQAIKTAKKVPSNVDAYKPTKYVTSTATPFVSSNVDVYNPTKYVTSTAAPFVSSTTTATPLSVYVTSTTPSPIEISNSLTPDFYPSSTPHTVIISPKSTGGYKLTPSTIAPPIHSNSLEYYGDENRVNPYIYHNGPTYPIDRNGNTYFGTNNLVYDDKKYDGVSVTNDGFRYYLPRAYHEEQGTTDEKKVGSFGYIDPFGIRRVVYYNAGRQGFEARKNNRYVGFNATPYDPRPYRK